ncbi:MAG: diguanylate cyclase [Desulfurivibrionaceae bacterium]
MIERLSEHFQSLRFKISAALFLVLTVSIGAAMYGTWTYERDQFIDMANDEAASGGRIIEKSLRNSMMTNNQSAIQTAVNEIAAIHKPPSRISIINPAGRVTVSSDPAMRGKIFDPLTSPNCIACHRAGDMAPPKKTDLLMEGENGPLLRNVIKINNEPKCQQCHPESIKILGVLIYDIYLSRTFAILKTVSFRIFLTGMLTFLAIGVVLWLTIDKFIHKPIKRLMEGFTQAGSGNFDFWVEESSSIEFGYMADQFNVMSRAINRFIQEIKGKNQETAILYSIVREVSETLEWERLLKIIVELVREIFEAEQGGLVVPHRKKKDCFDIIWRVKDEKRLAHLVYCLEAADLSLSTVVKRKELLEWQRGEYLTHQFKDDFQRLLIPLLYNKRAMGLICIKKVSGQSFSKHERAIIPALANHVAISLANSHLYHMAITDGLTDLYSKRHLLNKLDILTVRHEKYASESFFLLILDIDNFKELNDTHGHEAGDQVLVQLGEVLQKNIRFEDMPFRYGGEEFVILAPASKDDTELGMEIAERLRAAVENHVFECSEAPAIRQTVSIGVALFPLHGKTPHEIIKAADRAMYQAKNSGRNMVRGAARPQDDG